MTRSSRLTRQAIIEQDAWQAQVVAELTLAGEDDLVLRLVKCQAARLWRGPGWCRRCRTVGCAACRRPLETAWWAAIRAWAGPEATFVTIPLGSDPINDMRRLRRTLRDLRDRAARRDERWSHVAFGGLAQGDQATFLVQHPNLRAMTVMRTLRRRWPKAEVKSAAGVQQNRLITVETGVRLARARRSLEPLRAVILPQQRTHAERPDDGSMPMPMIIG